MCRAINSRVISKDVQAGYRTLQCIWFWRARSRKRGICFLISPLALGQLAGWAVLLRGGGGSLSSRAFPCSWYSRSEHRTRAGAPSDSLGALRFLPAARARATRDVWALPVGAPHEASAGLGQEPEPGGGGMDHLWLGLAPPSPAESESLGGGAWEASF